MSFGRPWDGLWPEDEDPPGGLARRVLEHLPGTAAVAFDRDLRFLLVAGPAIGDAGLHRAAIEGLRLEEVVASPASDTLARLYRRTLAGEQISLRYRSALNGRLLWLSLAPIPNPDGEVQVGIAVTIDVTSEAGEPPGVDDGYREAFDAASSGMALMLADGRLERVNAALCRMTGRAAGALTGTPLETLIHPEDAHHELPSLRELAGRGDEVHRGELRLLHRDGHVVDVALHAAALSGDQDQVLLELFDVGERRRVQERLQTMDDHDPLTSLLNRRGLEREVTAHIARAQRYGAEGALLAFDLDRFKAVNATHGRHCGDRVLTQVAELLRTRLRETDVIARLSADEFVVLVPRGDELDAIQIARDLLAAIRDARFEASGQTVRLTASIGISMFPPTTLSAEEMLISADLAMYDAKEAGRDDFAVYDERLGDGDEPSPRSRMNWVEEIREALHDNRMLLYAQPVVPVAGGPPAQFELLLRMGTPERGGHPTERIPSDG